MIGRIGSGLALLCGLARVVEAGEIRLMLPVDCEIGRTCFVQHYPDRIEGPGAQDFRCGTLTYEGHDGTDFRVPTLAAQKAGVGVLAAAAGTVLRVRDGVEDMSVAERGRDAVRNAECGNGAVIDHGGGWETQYCHLAKGSVAVKPGERVEAGARIGRIGLSGLTEFPHLHFTLRKDGRVTDPFAPGGQTCARAEGEFLWDEATRPGLAYEAGSVLNKGFASGPVAMEAIETGAIEASVPTTRSPALVAYVRAIGLRKDDRQVLTLFDPNGKALAENKAPPLDRDKAQWMMFSGVKRPEGGFRPGLYRAVYRALRKGEPAIEQAFGLNLRP